MINALTIHELKLRQAELAERAERLRQEWRRCSSVSNRALELGHRVKDLQARAEDYAVLLELIAAASGKEGS